VSLEALTEISVKPRKFECPSMSPIDGLVPVPAKANQADGSRQR
jgi:hypothetical protein